MTRCKTRWMARTATSSRLRHSSAHCQRGRRLAQVPQQWHAPRPPQNDDPEKLAERRAQLGRLKSFAQIQRSVEEARMRAERRLREAEFKRLQPSVKHDDLTAHDRRQLWALKPNEAKIERWDEKHRIANLLRCLANYRAVAILLPLQILQLESFGDEVTFDEEQRRRYHSEMQLCFDALLNSELQLFSSMARCSGNAINTRGELETGKKER